MKKVQLIRLLSLSTLLMTSCGTMHKLYGDYGVDNLESTYTDKTKDKENPELIINKLKKDNLVAEECVNSTKFKLEDKSWNRLCISQRTAVIGDLITLSNAECEVHKRSIWGNEATFNIITGTLTNAFSGAATVVTGGAGQAILAGLALFSNAERSLGNEAVYKNMIVPAIIQKIDEYRTNKFQILKQNIYITPKHYSKYPLNVAIQDLSDYHNSCSFMFGLQKAVQEGTKDSRVTRISELTNLLTRLSEQLDNRKYRLKSENPGITYAQINADTQYSSFKSRYDAVSEQLKTLEAAAESSPISTPIPEKPSNSGNPETPETPENL